MKTCAFIRFFLFVLATTTIIGILICIFARLFKLETTSLYVKLYIGFCLFLSIGMGILGQIYAKNVTLTINNSYNSISNIENIFDNTKYTKFTETDTEIVYCSNKYNEWFYGKIYINKCKDKITINSSKCIIDKYFSKLQ